MKKAKETVTWVKRIWKKGFACSKEVRPCILWHACNVAEVVHPDTWYKGCFWTKKNKNKKGKKILHG